MKYVIGILVMFISLLMAEWVSLGPATIQEEDISVVAQSPDEIIFEVSIPGFFETEIMENGIVYKRISFINSLSTSPDIGKPEIPAITGNIAVPENAILRCEVIAEETITKKGYNLYPLQEPTTDSEENTSFIIDHAFYLNNIEYPAVIASISDLKIWRDITLTNLRVYPFQYNPAKKELTIHKKMRIMINIQANNKNNKISVPERYSNMYKKAVLNDDWIDGQIDDGIIHYLTIAYDDYINAAQPLMSWYHKKGVDIDVVPISEIGSSPAVIKSYIEDHYNMYQTDYVLLVGDIAQIPAYEYIVDPYHSYVSDAWYSFIDGDDVYAELAIGRISANSASKVSDIISKILTYQKDPPLSNWINKSCLAAHCYKYYNQPPTYSSCKRDICTKSYSVFNPIMDTIMGALPGHGNTSVTNAINSGRNFVNYRGHGSRTSWSSWTYEIPHSWTTTEIYNLANGNKMPVVFNICCYNGDIHYDGECICESWVRKYPGGGVAALGASYESYTLENHEYDKEIYNAFCDGTIWRIGNISNYAAAQIINMGQYAEENVTMYLWVGDPMTEIWTDIPSNLTVNHASEVPLGPSIFNVTVTDGGNPVYKARVCVWKDNEVWASKPTNINGAATFTINPITNGTMYVTVTAHDYLPYEGEVIAGEPLSVSIEGYMQCLNPPGLDSISIDEIYRFQAHVYYVFNGNLDHYVVRRMLYRPRIGDPIGWSTVYTGTEESFDDPYEFFQPQGAWYCALAYYSPTEYLSSDTIYLETWDPEETDTYAFDSGKSIVFSLCGQQNPMLNMLKVRFMSPDNRQVSIMLYDVTGRAVDKLFNGRAKIGLNEVSCTNGSLSSGIYFVRVETNEVTITGKIIFQK